MQQQVLVFGEPLRELPGDLYIPPSALRVLLETFEGPLDLLLYLIKKKNMDILDIEVSRITEQYLAYIRMMEALDIALAADYLLMAATLAEIKARMLLPQPPNEQATEEDDPRAELAQRLLRYAQTKRAAENLAALPRVDDGTALSAHTPPTDIVPTVKPETSVRKLVQTMALLQARQALRREHSVAGEAFSLAERVQAMEEGLRAVGGWRSFGCFYHAGEGRGGVVVSLLAMLELDRAQKLEWRQEEAFADIRLRARAA